MKKKFLNIIVLYIVVILFSCSKCAMDYSYPITLKNMNGHMVDVYIADNNIGYPDTIFPPQREGFLLTIDGLQTGYVELGLDYEEKFSYLPSDTLSIYIFHTDTLNKYPWKKICDEYMVLKRYDLSLGDLKQLKFTVPYPPSPAMSNMKMYPPYTQK